MQVEELYDLTGWIDRELVEKRVQQAYSALLSVLNSNAQPNTADQSFEEQKETLIEVLSDIPLDQLSHGQLEVLEELEILNLLGDIGVSGLEDLLFKNVIDIGTTIKKLSDSIAKLTTGITWSQSTRTSLTSIVKIEEVKNSKDEAIIRVHFQKEAEISNLTDFKNWGKSWYDIGRGIAMAHTASPEDFRVIGASKGSIIFTLTTTYLIAKTTSFIILEVLKVIEKYFDIQKTIQEVKQLKLSNDAAVKALELEAENIKNTGKESILAETVKSLQFRDHGDGEKSKALETSIKQLITFVEKGGEVDLLITDESIEDDQIEAFSDEDSLIATRRELRAIFQQIRQIEKKIKLIVDKNI